MVRRRGDLGERSPLDEHALFEIGSITQPFTATLLADMAARGEVSLDDPVAKYLPAGTRVPGRGGGGDHARDARHGASPRPAGMVARPGARTLSWHWSGTGGFRTYLGLDLEAHRAVVVLTNAKHMWNDLGHNPKNVNGLEELERLTKAP